MTIPVTVPLRPAKTWSPAPTTSPRTASSALLAHRSLPAERPTILLEVTRRQVLLLPLPSIRALSAMAGAVKSARRPIKSSRVPATKAFSSRKMESLAQTLMNAQTARTTVTPTQLAPTSPGPFPAPAILATREMESPAPSLRSALQAARGWDATPAHSAVLE